MTGPAAGQLGIETGAVRSGAIVLRVRGDLVVSNMEQLERAVEEALIAETWGIVLDLADLGHVDTPGLALLYRLHERCAAGGSELVVAGLPDRFADLTQKLHLDQRMRFVRSVEEAFQRSNR
jgi:stage II sporulation protein AA (anti-sigma F factor antagonist)